MGKQGKNRKRRKVLAEVPIVPLDDSIDDIDTETLLVTIETLQKLTANPTLLKGSQFKALRTSLHNLQASREQHGILNGQSLSGLVSDALTDARWTDAIKYLQQMQEQKIVPKLGAVQRWVRHCDAASNDGKSFNDLVMRVLDGILRTADWDMVPPLGLPLNALVDWEPRQKHFHETFEVTTETKEFYKKQFVVAMHQKGEDRRTKNVYDFTLFHSLAGIS